MVKEKSGDTQALSGGIASCFTYAQVCNSVAANVFGVYLNIGEV